MENKKQIIVNKIKNRSIIAIVRGVEQSDLCSLLSALYSGGITFAELTFGQKPDDEVFEDLRFAIENFGDKMHIGAGTVTTAKRMQLAKDAGCDYLISPILSQNLIEFCKQNDLVSIVGAFTPTEIAQAYYGGADFIKVFPSNMFGAKYFKELKIPLNDIPLIAFGGMTTQTASEFFNAGAVGVGVGSALVDRQLIKKGDFETITKIAKEFVNLTK